MRFINRNKELLLLRNVYNQILDGVVKVVYIKGIEGIGKTALIRKFVKGLKNSLVLNSSTFEPFKNIIYEFLIKYKNKPSIMNYIKSERLVSYYPEMFDNTIKEKKSVDEFIVIYEFFIKVSQLFPLILVFDNLEMFSEEDVRILSKIVFSLNKKPILFIIISRNEFHFHKAIEIELKPLSMKDLLCLGYDFKTTKKIYEFSSGIPALIEQIIAYLNLGYDIEDVKFDIANKVLTFFDEEDISELENYALTAKISERKLIKFKEIGILNANGDFVIRELEEAIISRIDKEKKFSSYKQRFLELMKERSPNKMFELLNYMKLLQLDKAYPKLFSKYAYELAIENIRNKKYSKALKLLDLVNYEPYFEKVLKEKMKVYIKLGDNRSAFKIYEQIKYDEEAEKIYKIYVMEKLASEGKLDELEKIYKCGLDIKVDIYYQYLKGNFEKALEIANNYIELVSDAEKLDILSIVGNIYLALENYIQMKICFERALEISDKIDDVLYKGRSLYNLSLSYYLLEDYEKSFSLLKEAMDLSTLAGDLINQIHSSFCLAEQLLERGFPEEAKFYWEKCLELSKIAGINLYDDFLYLRLNEDKTYAIEEVIAKKPYNFEIIALEVIIPFYIKSKKFDKALEMLENIEPPSKFYKNQKQLYISFIKERDLENLEGTKLQKAKIYELSAKTLNKAIEIYSEIGFFNKLKMLGYKDNENKVKIFTFGGLRIFVDSKEVKKKELRSYKVQQLLLLFIKSLFYPGRLTFRAISYEMWKNMDEKKASKNFHYYLSILRKVLGKDSITYDDGYYKINLEQVEIDFAKFIELYEKARNCWNMGNKHKAFYYLISCYKLFKNGEFLKGIYDNIIDDLIFNVNNMVIDCLKMLSEYEFDAGNYLSAINYAQMIISYDHLDEHAYEIVVRSFIERKQMGQAMKLSQKIKNVFLRELKSEPQFLKSLKFFS